MKKSRSTRRRLRRSNLRRRPAPPRQGSTLMVVMVLMGMLSLLGVIFYVFAKQERSNAENYSEASKQIDEPSLDADALFDWALEQITVSTDPKLKNSMLWGSRYSLLSNAMGVGYHRPGDLHPFNGEGVNVIYDSNTGAIGVDQNRNGLIDDPTVNPGESDYRHLLEWVDSPAANKTYDFNERTLVNGPKYFPQPDVGYTYPDINNPFLCYVGKVRDQNGQIHQVVKPSYLLPGLLKTAAGAPNLNWHSDPTTASKVMRGHPEHLYVPPTSTNATPARRYMTDAEAVSLIGSGSYGFPFRPMDKTYDTTGSGAGAVLTQGRMGPYTLSSLTGLTGDHPIEFDYDNDGDGIAESILIDLDFPAQEDASGKMFVPLFLITIHDLDALLNLNVHGNLAKILEGPNDLSYDIANSIPTTQVANSVASPFGADSSGTFYYISRSNMGLGPAEINPLWALNARFGVDNTSSTVFTQHTRFFGNAPRLLTGAYPSWAETANMEFLWSKIGRPELSGGASQANTKDLYPGVYGEEYLLFQALSGSFSGAGGATLPRPGISLQDDNGNLSDGQGTAPYFQHPMDFTGLGSYQVIGNPKGITWMTSGPNRWINYTRYNSNAYSDNPTGSTILWGRHAGGGVSDLMTGNLTQGNGDDPYEISYYATDRRAFDNLLDADEMLYLHSNNSEVSRLNIASRLSRLLPFNFAKTTADNARGESIRRKFTTVSNDRKNFSNPYTPSATYGRNWEYSTDTASASGNLGPYIRNPPVNTYRFPPEFGSAPAVRRYRSIPISNPAEVAFTEDPVRPFTRALLEMDIDPNVSQYSLQRKLSVNHLFTYDSATGKYLYRPLMPHPDDPGTAVVSTRFSAIDSSKLPPYPPSNASTSADQVTSQEYWARRDRQQMARDIYVLLYLLGHGNDAVNTATTSNPDPGSGTALYSHSQLRQMAQFAVNVVDGMDRDNVMTRFEYDKDLSDGWNLDDDPYGTIEFTPATDNPNYPKDSQKRGEVWGVERMELSINEGLAFQTAAITSGTPTDHPGTSYDDTTAHFFAFVELFNSTPFDVSFTDNETWQVVLTNQARTWERAVSLKSGAGKIPVGQRYVIGSAEADIGPSYMTNKSVLRVDPNWTTGSTPDFTMQSLWMAPFQTTIQQIVSGVTLGLDLVDVTSPATTFRVTNETGSDLTTKGAWLSRFTGGTSLDEDLQIVLRRRAHPTRSYVPYTDINDNPYVDVDVVRLPKLNDRNFQLTTATDPNTAIRTQLAKLKSFERPRPLDGGTAPVANPDGNGIYHGDTSYAGPSGSFQYNSLTAGNFCSTGNYYLWQPHFDRDYASVMDLLLLPLFGPQELTAKMRSAMFESPEGQNVDIFGGGLDLRAKSAMGKFVVPEHPNNVGSSTPDRRLDNRWHRLLEFLEVPTRTNQNLGVGSELGIARIPGRMNLNMFRHSESLAAILDESDFLTLRIDGTDHNGNPYHPADAEAGELYDRFEGVGRNWWDEFLRSRDRVDPYWQSAGVDVPLPGTPGSHPFRSLADLSYTAQGGVKHASVEDTILRALPTDIANAAQTPRRLLELGNLTEHFDGGTNAQIDPMIRTKLLRKIANSATTRSNCFAIFISVKYFAAAADPAANGAIRIGGPLNGKSEPEHRGFFIVDRSKLEQGQYSGLPNYDFRTFVEYRKTLATQ